MTKRPFAIALMMVTLLAPNLSAEIGSLPSDLADESREVAEVLINFSRSIIRDINPPATGAERIVRNATLSDEGLVRTYFIEGEDLYRGRVISTFWIRLHKQIALESDSIPQGRRALSSETQALIGHLLNSLYDIADLNLDHQKVVLDRITTQNADNDDDTAIIEILGLNQVCEHNDLNSFKLIITRSLLRSHPIYDVELIKPFLPGL
jgi:hypothetical protein